VKQEVRFEQVLEYYGLLKGLRRKGEELVGYCPLHDERRYNRDAFSVNTARNIFHCFACGASGNVLDFVCQRENLEPREAEKRRRRPQIGCPDMVRQRSNRP